MKGHPFDDHFVGFLTRQLEGGLPAAQAAIIHHLCEKARSHHTCLPLTSYAAEDLAGLQALPICGEPGGDAPLIVSGNRLFLHRHYQMEMEVAEEVTRRNQPRPHSAQALQAKLSQQFGGPPAEPVDSQRLAVYQAATRNLAIITGGPGTGKTYVVTKVIELLQALNPGINIRLAAPTGKAAMRLMESLAPPQPSTASAPKGGGQPNGASEPEGNRQPSTASAPKGSDQPNGASGPEGNRQPNAASAPKGSDQSSSANAASDASQPSSAGKAAPEAVTLHRLLGVRRDGRSFRHSPDNPVPLDALIIDEASMVDLAMMRRVLAALPDAAGLILLGDPDQLPSVETGNVLGDLCAAPPSYSADFCKAAATAVGPLAPVGAPSKLTNAITRLERNYRFAADSPIGQLAAAIKEGKASLHYSPRRGGVRQRHAVGGGGATTKASTPNPIEVRETSTLTPENCSDLLTYWHDYLPLLQSSNASAEELLNSFAQCRILCSHRQGFPGVQAINQAIETHLERQGLKERAAPYFHGQPILITQNDYNLRLFNGDLGICVRREDGWQVAFPSPDGEPRHFLASRLPAHETCYAMTVHKAQGSEFNRVILILPERDAAQELLTRQLVYTAVTRSREALTLYCNRDDWPAIMGESAIRVSGMTDFL